MEQKQPKRGKALDIFRSKYAQKFIGKYKWSYLIGIIVLIIIDVLQTEVPLVVGETIDQVAAGGFTASMVWNPVIKLAIIAIVVFLGRIIWRWFIFGSARKIERDMRNELYSHLQTLSASYFHEHKAGEIMAQLVPYVDVCIANEEDCADVFGIHAEGTDIESGKLDHQAYISVARQLAQRFGCKKVAITLRGSISASENDWAGMLYDAATDTANFSRSYRIRLVDRVGGGDSFGGGLIYALSQGYSDSDAINFAVAASCLKQTIEHDFNQVKVDEVLALMKGSGSGRVQR